MNRLAVLRWALLAGFSLSMVSTGAADEGWHTVSVPFRPINIAKSQNALWICGVHEGIASSKDGGSSWQVQHQSSEGGILLNIGFVDAKVGYAGGTNGLLLLTKDGGQTWLPTKAGTEPILQVAFGDEKHGMIRTPSAVQLTDDGGAHWKEVSALKTDKELAKWKFVFALGALDATHAAIMLKVGPAQYQTQTFSRQLTEDKIGSELWCRM